ncbi:MAG: segregation and condensation protein A [Lachnospiraceae bacterium]|jgi:segregation and condensation protein A
MELTFHLAAFDGPLDLLLHLIEKNKVNIYDIPIAMITDQYMEYINAADEEDLDVISEFLVMAATLLDIKARMLLPQEQKTEEDESDPREELVRRLVEYRIAKEAAGDLKEREESAGQVLYRDVPVPCEIAEYQEPVDVKALIGDLTLQKLHEIFVDVCRRQTEKIDPVRSKFGKIVQEKVSMADGAAMVKKKLHGKRYVNFRDLLNENETKQELIVTFLVVLELIRRGYITAQQEETCGEIQIQVLKDPEEAVLGDENDGQ